MKLEKRPSMKKIASVPEGETVVSMVHFEGNVIVATSQSLYILKERDCNIGYELQPMKLEHE